MSRFDLPRPVRIVCTDRGQHPEYALALIVPDVGRPSLLLAGIEVPVTESQRLGFAAAESLTTTEPAEGRLGNGRRRVTARATVQIVNGTVHVPPCPTCKRHVRVRGADLVKVAQLLPQDGSGRVLLDVSL